MNQYGIASGFNAHGLQRSPVRDISTAPSKLESGEGRRASNSIQGFRNSTASPPVPPSPMRTSLNLLAPPQAPPPPVFMDVSKSWCKEVAVDLIQTTWRHRRARHRIGNDENTKYSSWSKVDTILLVLAQHPPKVDLTGRSYLLEWVRLSPKTLITFIGVSTVAVVMEPTTLIRRKSRSLQSQSPQPPRQCL